MLLFAVFAGAAQESVERAPIVVHLGDGSTVSLREWSLSYEYISWPEGHPQTDGTAARRTGTDLWVGRKAIPLDGSTLQVDYVTEEQERYVDGETRKVQVPRARGLKLVREGKTTLFKLEGPHRELLAPAADKKQMVAARSLDLRGESLTGTKMDFCVVSYTSLVECGGEPEHQIVGIDFPR